jgi:isopentenyl-diphosphate Delta-isomerase
VRQTGGRLRGLVVSGHREASEFVLLAGVNDRLSEFLGGDLFPGILNLELQDEMALESWTALKQSSLGKVLEPSEERFFSATIFPVRIAGEVPGGIILPHIDGYPDNVVEVVAGCSLGDHLSLEDGTPVELSWGSAAVKDLHVQVCLSGPVESPRPDGFAAYELEGDLPDFDFATIDTSANLFGRRLSMPLFVSSLTGGGARSAAINRRLAEAAQETRIGMAVGSQRLMLEEPSLTPDFQVRVWAPDILLLANLGLVHLNRDITREDCLRAVEAIEADGLMLYVNPLQEAMQVDGNLDFGGLLKRLDDLCVDFPYPVVVKEVGWGFTPAALRRIATVAVAGVDVAGRGGTDWGRVEALLAGRAEGPFEGLGISTADSLVAAIEILRPNTVVLASGGMRDGVQVAKALALGARGVGMGLPFLRWAADSSARVAKEVRRVEQELRVAMWYVGAKDVGALRGRIHRVRQSAGT